MKYRPFISLLVILIGSYGIALSQSGNKNYFITRVYYDLEGSDPVSQVDYFDAYGRAEQTVLQDYPNPGADMVTLQEYDQCGLPTQKWLPVSKSNNAGHYVDRTFFAGESEACFELTKYETTHRARPLKITPPGAPFNQRSSNLQYTSSPQDSVVNYSVTLVGKLHRSPNLIGSGIIMGGGAFCYTHHTTDEDGKRVSQFYDANQQLILTRQYDGNNQADTYQVYSRFGELCYVLPPQASAILKTTFDSFNDLDDNHPALLKFGYQYRYDNRGNRIYTRLPGAEPIYQIYDKADRMILSQDGEQRKRSLWTYCTYDLRGRILYKALVSGTMTLDEAVRSMENQVITQKYDAGNASLSAYQVHYKFNHPGFQLEQILVAYYYDNYRFLQNQGLNSLLDFQDHFGDPLYTGGSNAGLLTAKQVFSLDDKQLYSVQAYHYNRLDQQIQLSEKNFWGHYNHQYKKYDLAGRVLSEHRSTGIASDNQAYEKYDYRYDAAGNCTYIGYDINTGPLPQSSSMKPLVSRLYDGCNRLVNRIQGDPFYGNLEYKYTPSGRLTQIKGLTFEENLYYGPAPGHSSCASYNGNISARIWSYKNTNEESMYGYRYYYDSMDRLKQAVSTVGKEQVRETNAYNESYSYDLQGNILSLQRYGGPQLLIDDLHMTYDGNQLKNISDESPSADRYDVKEYRDPANQPEEFSYNANGCLNKDLDRTVVSIQYNCLNLPDTVHFANGNQLVFRYDGEGNKWEEHSLTATTPLFVPVGNALRTVSGMSFMHRSSSAWSGNVECTSTSGGSYDLSKVHHAEGYVEKLSWASTLYNMYYRHDYQGNVREVWRAAMPGLQAATVQHMQYYPGGMPWAACDNTNYQMRKYSGKRYLEMHGYDSYDFMSRTYAPDYTRFTTMDPMCEKYYSISPYAYCMNNPVSYTDPDGREVFISGVLSQEALKQLQSRVGDRISLSMDDAGKVSYTVNTDKKLKGDAKRMARMIDDGSIKVNLVTTNQTVTSTGNLMVGGAFMGNTVTTGADGNIVSARQEVNPTILGSADEHVGTPGKLMMHETTEAYQGARISQRLGVGVGMATATEEDNPNSVYNRAHGRATSQTLVRKQLYDSSGRKIRDDDIHKAVRAEWYVTKNGKIKIIQTLP